MFERKCVVYCLFLISFSPNVIKAQELSGDYAELVKRCTSTFQENIVSAFNNAMARNHRRINFIKTIHNLDSILFSLDNTKIELSELKLPWLPDFKVVNLSVDLCKLYLDIHFKLGNLKVSGNYEVNNVALQKVLPVSSNGIISVSFSDVSVQGRVGLLIQGDSFVPENYDVKYTWAETEVAVNYFLNQETQVENKISSPAGEQIIAEKIWLQLREILTTILKEQLKAVVVPYSVTESLADQEEKLRQFGDFQTAKANGLFDALLCAAKHYLVDKSYSKIETPSFEVLYRGKLTSTEQGIFESGPGSIEDLSTLSRLSDMSLFEDEHKIVVYGTLGIRQFKHDYEKFTTKYEDNEVSGSIKARIYLSEIYVKLSFDKNGDNRRKTKLEKIETRLLSDIETDLSGLGALSWLIPKTQSWVMGHLRSNAMEVLLKHIEEAINFAIEEEMRKSQETNSLVEVDKSKLIWSSIFGRHF